MAHILTYAVVIPTWRRPIQLQRLLNSLVLQIKLPDEIIIVCRNGDHKSIKVVAEWTKQSPLAKRHKLETVRCQGHLPPLISALNCCESDIFCQIDDDAIPRRNWLLELDRNFQDLRIGGIGGKVINHNIKTGNPAVMKEEIQTPGKLSWFGRPGSFVASKEYRKNLFAADCFIGCNMAFRSKALMGTIDMALNGGSAIAYETDIALNVKRKGYALFYDPEVIVDHYPAPRHIDAKRGWNSKECYWYAHNLTYICFKHLPWYGKAGFFLYFFLGGSWGCPAPATYILSLFRGRFVSWRGQFVPAVKGRIDGIKSYLKGIFNERQRSRLCSFHGN
jgi:GT2 family glycosyltransferase